MSIDGAVVDGLQTLPYHVVSKYIPLPNENHRLFGAGFLIVSATLAIEALAGDVWFREPWRRDIFPAVLLTLGWGLFMVAIIDPQNRVIHSLIGLMLVVAGIAERRYRHGRMTIGQANWLVVPALFAGGLEIGVFHSHGDYTSRSFIVHSLYGATATVMALARVYSSGAPTSVWRNLAIAVLVLALGMELLGLNHGSAASQATAAEYPALEQSVG